MAPVLAARLFPSATAPVDFGFAVGGIRLLGSHKTWRGLVAGVAAAALSFRGQQWLVTSSGWFRDISVIDYASRTALLGAGMGFAALAGDMVKSAIKRRAGIPPGRPWIPWDQVDWLIGVALCLWLTVPVPGPVLAAVPVVGIVLHLVVNVAGRLLGLRRDWI